MQRWPRKRQAERHHVTCCLLGDTNKWFSASCPRSLASCAESTALRIQCNIGSIGREALQRRHPEPDHAS
eukprot:10237131-Alexandrium_andersonii.AAC.1